MGRTIASCANPKNMFSTTSGTFNGSLEPINLKNTEGSVDPEIQFQYFDYTFQCFS